MKIFSGKYEVIGEIGRGGMGIVYKVRHRMLGTILALKTLPSYLASKPEFVSRFSREARVTAGLHHPNIVRVFDVDRDEEPYLLMEYIAGRDLSALLSRHGPLPLGTVVDVTTQVLEALAHAHSQEPAIVHRDIKPSNILIEEGTGRAVVTDFGIAKLLGDVGVEVTGAGLPLGTPRYCSPEQREGRADVDQRADLYSLGVVLHEMLGARGTSPYSGDASGEGADLRSTALLEIDGMPPALSTLVRRATAPDPEDRYRSAQQMLQELGRIREQVGSETTARLPQRGRPADESPRRLRVRRPAAKRGLPLLGMVLLVVAGVTAWATRWPSTWWRIGTAPARDSIAVLQFDNQRDDPESDWYSRALQITFNTELSKIPQISVVAPEVIEVLSAEKGMDPMSAARKLGVARFVTGSFAVVGGEIRIDARVVDAETGYQTSAVAVEGKSDRFFALQKSLALATLQSLAVELTEAQRASLRETTNTRLDRYRMLLNAEGLMEGRGAPTPSIPAPGSGEERLGFSWISVVHAAETPVEDPEIRRVLEEYRGAMETGDIDRLERLHTSFSSGIREAVRSYLATVRDLRVELADVEIDKRKGAVIVSFTRRDRFRDPETDEAQSLEIRMTKFLVPVAESWKFAAPREVGAWELLGAAEERNRFGSWKDRRARLHAEVQREGQTVRSSESRILETTGAGLPHRTRIDFTTPADLASTVFLRNAWPDGRAKEWMWTPSSRRARRLPVGEGTYFESSYGPELATRELEQITRLLQWTPADAEARVVGEERTEEGAATIIEVVPRRTQETSSRYRLWITEEDLLVRRVEIIGESGEIEKRVHLDGYERSGPYQVATEIELDRVLTGERVLLRLTEVEYDGGIPDRAFGLEQLMRGR